MDIVIKKNSKLESKFQKYKGRVVLRGNIVKDDSDPCGKKNVLIIIGMYTRIEVYQIIGKDSRSLLYWKKNIPRDIPGVSLVRTFSNAWLGPLD